MDYTMSNNNVPAWNPRCYLGKVGCNCNPPGISDSTPIPPGSPATTAGVARAMKHVAALPPQYCIKCNFCNEYAGKEHLDSEGRYTCRTCKQNPYT